MVVTFDLIGRKVLVANPDQDAQQQAEAEAQQADKVRPARDSQIIKYEPNL